ncbi:MAG: L,D-transpeptidase family protein [Rhodobacteraceae bacterium]|nr:L,D-transpeptidase family protein [Paracoccaceae bacterium]
MTKNRKNITRRQFGTGLAAFGAMVPVFSPAMLRAQIAPATGELEPQYVSSSFATKRWQDYFSSRRNGAIVSDTVERVLHYWSEDGETYMIFPTSVPISEELTRRGRTNIVRKVNGPEWRPTPNMLKRDPDLPRYVGPGPQNPLGTHALYLSWQYYRVHGTNDTRKIGRQASNGCIGLYNEDIKVLFDLTKVGTQVILI